MVDRQHKHRDLHRERLSAGESLYSPDGTVRLDVQKDGNLVVYCPEQILPVLWESMTAQTGSENYLEFQDNGNLVLYPERIPVWATDKEKNGRFNIALRPDLRAHPKRRVTGPNGHVTWVDI